MRGRRRVIDVIGARRVTWTCADMLNTSPFYSCSPVPGSAVACATFDTENMSKRVRVFVVFVLLTGSALLSSGCYVEQRADGKWWACDTVQTPQGPIAACQPVDVPLVK